MFVDRREPAYNPSRLMSATSSSRSRTAPAVNADQVLSQGPVLGLPSAQRRLIERSALLERMSGADWRVCVVAAPPGSGKTSLLSQWSLRDRRPTAWLALRPMHNSLPTLFADLAAAFAVARPDSAAAVARRRLRGRDVLRAVGLFCRALEADADGWLVVLDDVHQLSDPHAVDAVTALADLLPNGSLLSFGTRNAAALPLDRWRATGTALELGLRDLALSEGEAAALIADIGGAVDEEGLAQIMLQTEGWPAGVYLAGIALRRGRQEPAMPSPALGDGAIQSLLETEVLAGLDVASRRLLTLTSILHAVNGPLADHLTRGRRSAALLERLAEGNLMVMPLAGSGQRWYRYHSLLREVLLRQLDTGATDKPALHRRAAGWFERNGDRVEAVEHAIDGGDMETAARIIPSAGLAEYRSGRVAHVLRWLNRLDDQILARQPQLAMLATLIEAVEGDPLEATRWSVPALRQTSNRLPEDPRGPDRWLVRAMLCQEGPAAMLADADRSLEAHDENWPWRPLALVASASAAAMLDDMGAALARFGEVERAPEVSVAISRFIARAERALAAMADRRWADAEALLALDRSTLLGSSDVVRTAGLLWLVADARLCIHRGDVHGARERLVRALAGRVYLSWSVPWYAVRSLTELARAQLLLADQQGARMTLAQARDVLEARPRLGRLADSVTELMAQAAHSLNTGSGVSALTLAELRLLPLLQTYLSFKEIGERLGISGNTVKSEAMSIYAKLEASSRGEAVERAVEFGLLEDIFA